MLFNRFLFSVLYYNFNKNGGNSGNSGNSGNKHEQRGLQLLPLVKTGGNNTLKKLCRR